MTPKEQLRKKFFSILFAGDHYDHDPELCECEEVTDALMAAVEEYTNTQQYEGT